MVNKVCFFIAQKAITNCDRWAIAQETCNLFYTR